MFALLVLVLAQLVQEIQLLVNLVSTDLTSTTVPVQPPVLRIGLLRPFTIFAYSVIQHAFDYQLICTFPLQSVKKSTSI
jgi:hypothetical protein